MTAPVTTREPAFDRLRGLIMVLMAIDHASFFIARVHPAETWAAPPPYYPDLIAFLTRWPTHLCAPGFFMLMGIGLVWFAESRRAAGWSAQRIARFYVSRGVALLVIQHLVENPAWLLGIFSGDASTIPEAPPLPGVEGNLMLGFAVLSALGIAMIFWGISWRLPSWAIAAVCLGLMTCGRLLTPEAATGDQPIPGWKLMLFVPGMAGIAQNMYPWMIWLVPAGVGIILGRIFLRQPASIAPIAGGLAIAGGAAFVGMRLAGWGEFHSTAPGWMGWLSVTKYPPSEAFLTLMLSLDLALLAVMAKWPARWLSVFGVYGRAPFFFYLAHLYAFGALSWAFRSGTSWSVMYFVWAAVVVALYPACAAYARFKFAKPSTSMWRMF